MKKVKNITGWLIIITSIVACLYMGIGIWQILAAGPFTSFPWYTACCFTALYFGPVVLLELLIYAVLGWKCRSM